MCREVPRTAGSMDGWDPADMALLSSTLYKRIAQLYNLVEEGAQWPKATRDARAAFLAKEENAASPLDYRLLLMMSTLYRSWAKIRLADLMPWISRWALWEIYAGALPQGASDATYVLSLKLEEIPLYPPRHFLKLAG